MQDNAVQTAAALAPHVGGAEVVNELYGYMNSLGIQGIGLVEATQRAPIIGHIIGDPPPLMLAIACTALACMVLVVQGQSVHGWLSIACTFCTVG